MDLVALAETVRPIWAVWLIVLFAGIVFWAFRPKNKKRLEKYGDIPLADDE